MDIEKFEKILERSLTKAEIKRFQKNDALWSIIIALEYHRDYYQILPEKIQKIMKVSTNSESFSTSYKIIFSSYSLFFLLFLGAFCVSLGYKIGDKMLPLPEVIFFMPIGYVLAGTLIVPAITLIILTSKSWIQSNNKKAAIQRILATLSFTLLGWIFSSLR